MPRCMLPHRSGTAKEGVVGDVAGHAPQCKGGRQGTGGGRCGGWTIALVVRDETPPLFDAELPMASAAKAMAAAGISLDHIAEMLHVEVGAVRVTVHGGGALAAADWLDVGGGGPNRWAIRCKSGSTALLDEEGELCCPISLVLFISPVKAADDLHLRALGRGGARQRRALCLAHDGQGDQGRLPAERGHAGEGLRLPRRARCGELLEFIADVAQDHPNMGVEALDRVIEYLSAVALADVATLSPLVLAACDAMLQVARSKGNPQGKWRAKPAELRRINGLKMQATTGAGADMRMLTCLVCFDDTPALNGIECSPPPRPRAPARGRRWSFRMARWRGTRRRPQPRAAAATEKHFICNDRVDGHVTAAISYEQLDAFTRRGGVCCVSPDCPAPPFATSLLAKVLPEATFSNYTTAKEKVAEQRINAELAADFEQRLAQERAKGQGGAALDMMKEHIIENILTLSCPRCHQAFLDYNGCMALTCSRAGCGCGFCAICQADCGTDAHGYVGGGCPYAERVGVKKGEFFIPEDKFKEASRKMKAIRLQEYLETIPERFREQALKSCERELRDEKINPKTGKYNDGNENIGTILPQTILPRGAGGGAGPPECAAPGSV